jgi:hypothetical protein
MKEVISTKVACFLRIYYHTEFEDPTLYVATASEVLHMY